MTIPDILTVLFLIGLIRFLEWAIRDIIWWNGYLKFYQANVDAINERRKKNRTKLNEN